MCVCVCVCVRARAQKRNPMIKAHILVRWKRYIKSK